MNPHDQKAHSESRRTRPRVIAQIRGGLGNQLFCYAAARRLALANDAELVLDDVTGFTLDHSYRRNYLLHHFRIVGRRASRSERSEPLGRYRRALQRYLARSRPFMERNYIAQQGVDFEPQLLDVKVTDTVYLEGYWQSENYFKDVAPLVRKEFRLNEAPDSDNQTMAAHMRSCNSVALHVRWFNDPRASNQPYNVSREYYRFAIERMTTDLKDTQFFVFSDNLAAARELCMLRRENMHFVDVNHSAPQLDLWLMSQCRNFIIANSTFSWWGAWLSDADERRVIAPAIALDGITAWGFRGLLPQNWITIAP